jgi:hypothetical protein
MRPFKRDCLEIEGLPHWDLFSGISGKFSKSFSYLVLGGIDSGGIRQYWYMASSFFGKVGGKLPNEGYHELMV